MTYSSAIWKAISVPITSPHCAKIIIIKHLLRFFTHSSLCHWLDKQIILTLEQGCPTLFLSIDCPAKFSYNPNQTQLANTKVAQPCPKVYSAHWTFTEYFTQLYWGKKNSTLKMNGAFSFNIQCYDDLKCGAGLLEVYWYSLNCPEGTACVPDDISQIECCFHFIDKTVCSFGRYWCSPYGIVRYIAFWTYCQNYTGYPRVLTKFSWIKFKVVKSHKWYKKV